MKELRRRQDEDEQRRREEFARHSAGADKTDGEKSEAGSIKSGGKKIKQFRKILEISIISGKILEKFYKFYQIGNSIYTLL